VTPDPATPAPDAESGAEVADEQVSADNEAKSGANRKRHFGRDLAVIVIAALVLTILLKAFVVQVFSIPSGSMENTLLPGDRILVNKMVYRLRPIERGDIVVFSGAASASLTTRRAWSASPGREPTTSSASSASLATTWSAATRRARSRSTALP
jgi:hypothetical protein